MEWQREEVPPIQTPLGDKEIKQLVKTRVIDYPKLRRFKTIDELLRPYGSAVILIVTGVIKVPNSRQVIRCGHWCALLWTVGGVEFFDPYGVFPDHEFKEIGQHKRAQFDEARNDVSRLLSTARVPIMFNQLPLQVRSPYVNTCGRWCALRILHRHQTVEEFARHWNDQSVTDATEAVLRPSSSAVVEQEEEPRQTSLWGHEFNVVM